MDASLTEIKADAATNEQLVISQKAEITQLQFANDNLTNEIAQYKAAVDALEAKLKEAYAGIDKQNGAISNLVAQRNELVQKYNDRSERPERHRGQIQRSGQTGGKTAICCRQSKQSMTWPALQPAP